MTNRDTKMATNMAIKNTETPGKRPTRPHGQRCVPPTSVRQGAVDA